MDLESLEPHMFYYEGPGEGARTILIKRAEGEIVVSRRISDGLSLVDEKTERFRVADVKGIADRGDRVVLTLKSGFFQRARNVAF
jgi:hypothetical protein